MAFALRSEGPENLNSRNKSNILTTLNFKACVKYKLTKRYPILVIDFHGLNLSFVNYHIFQIC